MEQKALFWDFDGTLTYCHHVWSSSLMRVLWEYEEAESVTLEQIRPLTHHGYPWEEPDDQAHRFRTSEGFWGYMEEKFASAFRQLGLSPQRESAAPHFKPAPLLFVSRYPFHAANLPVAGIPKPFAFQ